MSNKSTNANDLMRNEIKNYTDKTDLVENKKLIQIIHLDLSRGSIYKQYSNSSILKNEIFEFIEDTYDMFYKKDKIFKLYVNYPKGATDEEINKINSLLRAHYAIMAKKAKEDIRDENKVGILLLIVGLILIFITYTIEKTSQTDQTEILDSVLQIISWLFVWEAGSSFFLRNASNRSDKKEYKILYMMVNNLYNKNVLKKSTSK